MPTLDEVSDNGFTINNPITKVEDMALTSLRLALKAFCSTYQSMSYGFPAFRTGALQQLSEKSVFMHSFDYYENYIETVIHLHHFLELSLKKVLRREHPLLAVETQDKPDLYYKLVKGEEIGEEEYAQINTIEFSKTLNRMKPLIVSEVKAGNMQHHWLLSEFPVLEKLNRLRNRVWHRGTYVLSYNALDIFVGKYVLPIALRLATEELHGDGRVWKHQPLKCEVDPLTMIIAEAQKYPYNAHKVAYLKEMGRAAYVNPLSSINAEFGLETHDYIKKAQRLAELEHSYMFKSKRLECPVCGVDTFIAFSVIEDEAYDKVTGERVSIEIFVEAECTLCTFKVYDTLGNPSAHGIPIPDLWT